MAAMETIQKLKKGEMDVRTASEIRNLCNTVIDVAKVQVEYLKALPNQVKEQITINEVKAIAGTLVDRDSELDQSLVEIEEAKKQQKADDLKKVRELCRAHGFTAGMLKGYLAAGREPRTPKK
jgi:hypothetical protein